MLLLLNKVYYRPADVGVAHLQPEDMIYIPILETQSQLQYGVH
jgi:hypothetical protein